MRRRTVGAIAAVVGVGAFAAHVSTAVLQQDFAAYWVAGKARARGLDPYVNHLGSEAAPRLWDGVAFFRHSRFLYPPLAAELCRPLAVAALSRGEDPVHRRLARRLARGARRCSRGGATAWPSCWWRARSTSRSTCTSSGGRSIWRCSSSSRSPGGIGRRRRAAGAALALAAAFKPSLLGVLPVLGALGRWRWTAATLGGCAALAGLTVAISGPALLREYGAVVLPRAALFGEGGTDPLPVHEETYARLGFDDDDGTFAMDGRRYRISLWDGLTASASLPRLLAPEVPSRATAWGPYLAAVAALIAAARAFVRRRRRGPPDPSLDDAEHLLFAAASIVCVVTSPAGWAMGLVWALPIVPAASGLRAAGRLPRGAAVGLGLAWLACALPSLVPGWAALAGAALALAAGRAALLAAKPAARA